MPYYAGIQSYVDNSSVTYPYITPLTIDIQDAVNEAGTPLIVWNPNGQDNQMWELVPDPMGSGYSYIQSKLSEKTTGKALVIDIKGGSKAAAKATTVQIWTMRSTGDYDNQLWKFVDSGVSGGFKDYSFIESKLTDPTTGKPWVIDIKGGYKAVAPRKTLDIWTQNPGEPYNHNQLWMNLF